MTAYQPFIPLTQNYWVQIRDGNLHAFDIFTRHYSFRRWRDRNGINGKRITQPGESIVLMSQDGRAIFVWSKSKFRLDTQTGVNCAVFRNESTVKSSELIREAEVWALKKWPGERLFTFVNGAKVKSANPGYCFQKAGWRKCGKTKAKGLIILEKLPILKLMEEVKVIRCENCGAMVDPRNLSDVMRHGWFNKLSGAYECYDGVGEVQFSTARKVGETIEWAKSGKRLDLN